jgi:hypothetical protein
MKKKIFSIIIMILTASVLLSAVSAAPRDEAKPGEAYNVVYYEEFNYENRSGNAIIEKLLGWDILKKSEKNAPTEPSATYSIKDGKLYINNDKSNGVDSYIKILDDAHMMGTWMHDYTVQFDLRLTSAGDHQRYIAILTDYKDSTAGYYHSFHLRMNGSANNQARMNGKWSTFDAPGDYYAADQNDSDGTSSIAKKILGKDYVGGMALKDIDLTVRIVCEKLDIGPRVYIRNNTAGGDFQLVSRAGGDTPTSTAYRQTGGKSIVLKAGGKVNGYVDNIVVYKGTGEPCWEEIKLPETTESPETTAAPETEPVTEPMTDPITDPVPEESGCSAAIGTSGIITLAIAAAFVMRKKKR